METNRNGKKMKFDFNIAWKNVWKFTDLTLELILINRDDLRGGDGHGPDLFYG